MAEPAGRSQAAADTRTRRAGWPAEIAVLVAILAAAAIVSGCGDGDDEPATQTTATETTTTTEEEAKGAPGGDGEEGGIEAEGAGGISPAQGNVSAGKQLFAQNCAVCHGTKGTGAATGPSLQDPELAEDSDEVVTQIVQGGGGMPAFGDQLSDKEIADISAFVVEEIAQR